MVIPWGVGAGDFVAVAKLTGKVISELKENGEAPAKYQNVIIELGTLERALSRLYELKPGKHELKHLDAIRAAATACKRPLEDFVERVSKFDKSLGTWGAKEKRFRGIGRRLQFNVAFEKEVKDLRVTLTSHVSTINMLLMTQTLESTTAAETVRAVDTMRLEDAHRALSGRLEEVDVEQERTNVQTREGLEALQEEADRSGSSDNRIQIGPVDQDKTMRSIEADILQIKDGMEKAKKAEPIPNASNGINVSLSALDIMSRVFALAVSGVMVASARDMARQAREISTISTQGGRHTPGTHTTNQPMAANAECFVEINTEPGKHDGSLLPHLTQAIAVPASMLSFIVRVEELWPVYGAQELQFMPQGWWLPPTKKSGYQTGRSYSFRWANGSMARLGDDSPLSRSKNQERYSAATVFTHRQEPDPPHLLAVEFDARLVDAATHSSGWTSLNFEHKTKKDNESTFSYLTTSGSQPRLAAPGPKQQVPQLLPKIYDFHWVHDAHERPIPPLRTHAGLIGSLPLLIALAAFSAPGEFVAAVLSNFIEAGKWRPHQFQYPSGHENDRGVVVSIYYDPTKPKWSQKVNLEKLENGEFGPFYGPD